MSSSSAAVRSANYGGPESPQPRTLSGAEKLSRHTWSGKIRHLDLFSGIGGFALAARWVGWETVAFCEIDPYCRRVLRKNFGDEIPIYEDVRQVMADPASEGRNSKGRASETISQSSPKQRSTGCCRGVTDGTTQVGPIDIITAGFPCQDISHAGKQAGIEGERSGLWSELARIIGEVRPRYAVLENVSALLSGDRGRWFQRVLGDLAEIGYDCEWHCIPASSVGAPHRRDRVWIIAYPSKHGCDSFGLRPGENKEECGNPARLDNQMGSDVADAECQRPQGQGQHEQPECPEAATIRQAIRLVDGGGRDQWKFEPDVGRVANGVPSRVDRLRGLGNAIVPQVAEIIFRAIDHAHSNP